MFEGVDFGPIGGGMGMPQPRERQPIDVEALITWALQRSGRLPWANARDRELAFDSGLTARPRKAPHVTWGTAEACAGLRFDGRSLRAMMTPGPDASRVLLAIGRLEPGTAALVIACGRAGIRPDWMPGVEPRQVQRAKRCRKKHRKIAVPVWEPCSPDTIRVARDAYRRWRAGVAEVWRQLADALESWEIDGFAAPIDPWRMAE